MIELRVPSRLHFGLLAYSQTGDRQFGGIGLMVRRPDVVVRVEPAEGFTATGPLAERASAFAQRFAERCEFAIEGVAIQVVRAPRPHTGLGTGTQLGMAVARAMALLIGREDWGPAELAALVGRGQRSAVGVYGFFTGGLVVEGGKLDRTRLSPMVMQHAFCERWRLVLVCPNRLEGISGRPEQQAFDTMPSISEEATAQMCHLVMLGLVPAMIEGDLDNFGQSIYQLQQIAGSCFKSAQGGVYSHPMLEQIVRFIRHQGVPGVGQSSWGPTLYAVTSDQERAQRLAVDIRQHFKLDGGEVIVTRADNGGAAIISKDGAVHPVAAAPTDDARFEPGHTA